MKTPRRYNNRRVRSLGYLGNREWYLPKSCAKSLVGQLCACQIALLLQLASSKPTYLFQVRKRYFRKPEFKLIFMIGKSGTNFPFVKFRGLMVANAGLSCDSTCFKWRICPRMCFCGGQELEANCNTSLCSTLYFKYLVNRSVHLALGIQTWGLPLHLSKLFQICSL